MRCQLYLSAGSVATPVACRSGQQAPGHGVTRSELEDPSAQWLYRIQLSGDTRSSGARNEYCVSTGVIVLVKVKSSTSLGEIWRLRPAQATRNGSVLLATGSWQPSLWLEGLRSMQTAREICASAWARRLSTSRQRRHRKLVKKLEEELEPARKARSPHPDRRCK